MKCVQEGDKGRQDRGNQSYIMWAREVKVPIDFLV